MKRRSLPECQRQFLPQPVQRYITMRSSRHKQCQPIQQIKHMFLTVPRQNHMVIFKMHNYSPAVYPRIKMVCE